MRATRAGAARRRGATVRPRASGRGWPPPAALDRTGRWPRMRPVRHARARRHDHLRHPRRDAARPGRCSGTRSRAIPTVRSGPRRLVGRAALGSLQGHRARRSFKRGQPARRPSHRAAGEHLVQRQVAAGGRARARHRRQPAVHGRVARAASSPASTTSTRSTRSRERWKRQPDMQHGRWYPTQLLMPDGRTFIMGGLDERGYGDKNEDIELFTPSRSRSGRGRLRLIGGSGVLGNPGQPAGRRLLPAPVLDAERPRAGGRARGRSTPGGSPRPASRPRLRWQDLPNSTQSRVWGTAVLLPAGPDGSHQVEQLGGSDKPKADSFEPDADALATNSVVAVRRAQRPTPAGTTPAAPRAARSTGRARTPTPCCCPTARWSTVGGGWGDKKGGGENGAPGQWAAATFHLTTELWSPRTARPGAWGRRSASSAPTTRPRCCCRTAAWSRPATTTTGASPAPRPTRNFIQDSAEIYEPPYLFDGNRKAPRPKLLGAPKRVKLEPARSACA